MKSLIESISIFATDNPLSAVTIGITIIFSIGSLINIGKYISLHMREFIITMILTICYIAIVIIGILYAPSLQLNVDGNGIVIILSIVYCILLFWLND
jgi:Na+/H+ antiporter NhaA